MISKSKRDGRGGARRRWAVIALWVVVVAGIGVLLSRLPGDQRVLAVPLEINEGDSGSERFSRSFRVGQPVLTNQRMTMPPGEGSMILSLVPGITARGDNQAEFSLDELTVRKNGVIIECRHAGVTLYAGRMRFAVASPTDRQIDLAVVTLLGTVSSQPGSVFSVDAELGTIRVLCVWGEVVWRGVRKGNPPVVLRGGEFCDRETPSPSSAGADVARNIVEDTHAQEELADVFRLGAHLNALEERRRSEISFSLLRSR